MRIRLLKWLALCSSAIISGCLEVSGGGGGLELISDIQVECPKIICTQASATIYVGWVNNTNLDCEQHLSQLLPGNYDQGFIALGSTVAVTSGPILFGNITSWRDANENPISEIANARYKVCGHYDANNNKYLDPGEAVGEIFLFPGSSPQILEDWFNI